MPRTGLTASEIRQKAIDATMARMREDGFDKVRLTDIARELGLSHAALYAHFADRTALLDAVSEQWLSAIDTSRTGFGIVRDPARCNALAPSNWSNFTQIQGQPRIMQVGARYAF